MRDERREQMKLALQLRSEGYTYKEIGIRVPITAKNGNARVDKPRARSAEGVRQLLGDALRKLIPEESRDDVAEALEIGRWS
jgi:hypothetical protein